MSSCFHPETKVKTKSGEIYFMKDLPLGVELEDGGKVFSVMKIDNPNKLPFYKIAGGINDDDILVTGDHFIYDNETNTLKDAEGNVFEYPKEKQKSKFNYEQSEKINQEFIPIESAQLKIF